MERPHNKMSREDFEKIRQPLEQARKRTRPRKHDLYDVFNAVLYFLEESAAWRSLPRTFPPWRTVHEYFTQWTEARADQPSLLEWALEETGRTAALDRLRVLLALR